MPRLRGKKWQGDAVIGVDRVRKSFNSQREAEAFEEASRTLSNAPSMTIGVLFPKYCDELWKDKATYKDAKSITADLVRRLGPSTPVHRITEDEIDALVEDLEEDGKANQTINNRLTRLSKLLKRAKRRKLLTAMPTIQLKPQKRGRIRFLSKDEEARLFAALSDRDRWFSTFLLYTGCRYGEAVRLRWDDVSGGMVTFWVTKTNLPRSVPVSKPVQDALAWARRNSVLQTEGPFHGLSYSHFRRRWIAAREACGMGACEDVIPYTLRHTCASRLVQAGVDLRRVKDWMGHTNIKTTMNYAHLSREHLLSAAAVFDRDYDGGGNTPVPNGVAQLAQFRTRNAVN